jgi:hypothetical protein
MNRILLKTLMGIEKGNCETCSHLGSDGDGYEYNGSWPVCHKHDKYSYLKSFPFKKEMNCWSPDFWFSRFVEIIKNGTDKELDESAKHFRFALFVGNHPENSAHLFK